MLTFFDADKDNAVNVGLWTERDGLSSVCNVELWNETVVAREQVIRAIEIWRDQAVIDGWVATQTYANEPITRSATLKRDGFSCHVIARSGEQRTPQQTKATYKLMLGTGIVYCLGPDGLQIMVPARYPGFQYFKNALVTCKHCHRGPNRACFTDDVGDASKFLPVVTRRYSFAERACDECLPKLRHKHERQGWNK